ncbi:hypothetical protein SEPCBS119000_003778 [Sporothrix epigloea]|uniref:Lpxtg-domain-containing protein n=1 Tax=Sporothrix epigloea TaxID=1892477 RepID=A0ABP0DNH7_9PEZI
MSPRFSSTTQSGMRSKLVLVTAVVLASSATALLVAPGSPCEQYCGNVLSTTTGADMTCQDSDYASTSTGVVFEACIGCELQSAYSTGNISDLNYLLCKNANSEAVALSKCIFWLMSLDNLRYAIVYCLFGLENNTNSADSPCIIKYVGGTVSFPRAARINLLTLDSPACGMLESAFTYDNMTVGVGSYGFCQDWIEIQVPKCTACLSSSSPFLQNYVIILDAACRQMPNIGSTLGVQGGPFSTTPMTITTPSTAPLYTYTPVHSAISLGAEVGIAVGGFAFFLVATGFLIVFFGRRRRRAFLKSIEARQSSGQDGSGPHVASNGWPSSSMFQTTGKAYDRYATPTSTQPLRGWENASPVSVSTAAESNGYFPRHLSPHKSQGNSPIGADDGSTYSAWPIQDSMAHFAAGSVHDNLPGSAKGQPWPVAHTRVDNERVAHEYELAQIGAVYSGTSSRF